MEDLTNENESLINERQKLVFEMNKLDMENIELKYDMNIMKNKTPMWVALPTLPQCYYKPGFVRSVARIFGPLLSIASATLTQSTAMCARFCVELDLSKEYPSEIYVGTEASGDFLDKSNSTQNRAHTAVDCVDVAEAMDSRGPKILATD